MIIDCKVRVEALHPDEFIHYSIKVADDADEDEIEARAIKEGEFQLKEAMAVYWECRETRDFDYN